MSKPVRADSTVRVASLLLLGLLAGCATPPEDPLLELNRSVKAHPVKLDAYEPPAHIGAFQLQGSIANQGATARLLRYVREDGLAAEFALYPLPGGWDSYAPEQAVAGHYGQLRQQQAGRLTRRGASRVEALGEGMTLDAQGQPIAEAVLVAAFADGNEVRQALLLTLSDRLFIRLLVESASEEDLALARDMLETFTRELRPATPASSAAP